MRGAHEVQYLLNAMYCCEIRRVPPLSEAALAQQTPGFDWHNLGHRRSVLAPGTPTSAEITSAGSARSRGVGAPHAFVLAPR